MTEVALTPGGPPPVWACLATIPSRKKALRKTLESLLPQVDRIHVTLNGFFEFDFIPCAAFTELYQEELFFHPRVSYSSTCASVGQGGRPPAPGHTYGDAGKFRIPASPGNSRAAYYLICDDDIFYPPDYAQKMIGHVEHFERRAVVGVHGVRLREPVRSYRADRDVRHCLHPAEGYRTEHILGTGTLALHGSVLEGLTMECFENGKMADIWFGLWAQEYAVSLVSVPRERGWLQLLVPPEEDSLWNRMLKEGDQEQVAAINRRHWVLHEPSEGER